MLVENVKIYGLPESIKASKYPMATDTGKVTDEVTENVLKLASCEIGTGHDTFLQGVIVEFDLTFTVKAWTEAERYHFFDFVSSQSTMHRLKSFDLDKQYCEYVDDRMIEIMRELQEAYNKNPSNENFLRMVYSNPCGFKLTARMVTNYRQLKTIYKQRKSHKLPEWKLFCKWIETLPMFFDILKE